MTPQQVRRRLDELIRASSNDDYASVSMLIGRNHAYVQQFIKRGVPQRLKEEDRRLIARHFGVSELELGGPITPGRSPRCRGCRTMDPSTVMVPRYDVPACADDGGLADTDLVMEHLPFRADWLRALSPTPPDCLAIIAVAGDAMFPTLADGDDILIDLTERTPRQDGIYVLRRDDALQVKRVSISPASGRLTIRSDNTLYQSWTDCDPAAIDILGRVIWVGRRL